MSDRLHVATRKGLFTFDRGASGGWSAAGESFVGDPVTMLLDDARDGTLYAALNLGHFGVKLHRSTDSGRNWEEVQAPQYAPEFFLRIPQVDQHSTAGPDRGPLVGRGSALDKLDQHPSGGPGMQERHAMTTRAREYPFSTRRFASPTIPPAAPPHPQSPSHPRHETPTNSHRPTQPRPL